MQQINDQPIATAAYKCDISTRVMGERSSDTRAPPKVSKRGGPGQYRGSTGSTGYLCRECAEELNERCSPLVSCHLSVQTKRRGAVSEGHGGMQGNEQVGTGPPSRPPARSCPSLSGRTPRTAASPPPHCSSPALTATAASAPADWAAVSANGAKAARDRINASAAAQRHHPTSARLRGQGSQGQRGAIASMIPGT